MSKRDLIKPGQFKLRGKLRASQAPGPPKLNREEYAEERAGESVQGRKPEPAAKARKKSHVKGNKRG